LAYLGSERWAAFRQEIIDERGYECERCGETEPPLHLHHLTYVRMGHEAPSDVELLCPDCHDEADEEREAETGGGYDYDDDDDDDDDDDWD